MLHCVIIKTGRLSVIENKIKDVNNYNIVNQRKKISKKEKNRKA